MLKSLLAVALALKSVKEKTAFLLLLLPVACFIALTNDNKQCALTRLVFKPRLPPLSPPSHSRDYGG